MNTLSLPQTAIQKLTMAEKWLAEAKSLDDLRQIHDIAVAADAYAKAHRLGLEAENHAMEVRLLAARRIGELVPAVPPEKRSPEGKGMSEARTYPIPKQRLSEFRKLAKIPEEDFKERIEIAKAKEEKITYNKILKGNSQIASPNSQKQKPVFNETNENIEWAKWSWNPVTGCKHGCPYCYARDIANRFYEKIKFEPTFHEYRLIAPAKTKIPDARKNEEGIHNVFVCSMADLFGDWVPQEWIDKVVETTIDYPEWNFLFLTKNPKRMIEINWPNNAWVGATVDVQKRVDPTEEAFRQINAKTKFVSCEPLLEEIQFNDIGIFDWVIIGSRSKNSKLPAMQPKREWVFSMIRQSVDAGCMIYCKPNLKSLIKEYPKGE